MLGCDRSGLSKQLLIAALAKQLAGGVVHLKQPIFLLACDTQKNERENDDMLVGATKHHFPYGVRRRKLGQKFGSGRTRHAEVLRSMVALARH